jgi:tRNA 5-methylaminomethyl-2-thiouridine biosynthesis bifunctional protein
MPSPIPAISTAELEWQLRDGIEIPVSKQFGDVYFSTSNGLLESRHVFLQGNDLATRLPHLLDQQCFCVAETGFGTGLNFLALWQLWQQLRPDNHSHLHFISVEKYPLTVADLSRALALWPELHALAEQLLAQYPLPLAGCHRLYFAKERLSLDLWLGDAADCLPLISSAQPVNAWFLDGFAPSCNPELWQTQIFQHIMRLSGHATTFASFSVAGVLKRALSSYGVDISRPKGFGRKREMLKAIWNAPPLSAFSPLQPQIPPREVAIIGAGIAGLNCAWAFAQRGIHVTLYEQHQPLSGASGNPLALLNPKLAPIEQVANHLMSCSWQYSLRFYRQFTAYRPLQVYQLHEKNPDAAAALCQQYADHVYRWQASPLSPHAASLLTWAGALNPQQFAQQVLSHPRIQLKITKIVRLEATAEGVHLFDQQTHYPADEVMVCNALALNQLCPEAVTLKAIRGQVSVAPLHQPLSAQALNEAYSYGGYALGIDAEHLLFGASFLPNQHTTEIRDSDQQHNFQLLAQALPTLSQQLTAPSHWQARAALRAQSPDYLPLVGRLQPQQPRIHCLAGLGSKGFLFAPLCSEILLSQILGQPLPVPAALAALLRPYRFRKKPKQANT